MATGGRDARMRPAITLVHPCWTWLTLVAASVIFELARWTWDLRAAVLVGLVPRLRTLAFCLAIGVGETSWFLFRTRLASRADGASLPVDMRILKLPLWARFSTSLVLGGLAARGRTRTLRATLQNGAKRINRACFTFAANSSIVTKPIGSPESVLVVVKVRIGVRSIVERSWLT